MRKTRSKLKKRKGAALVVAILLSAIIGSAAIGVTAIAFRQVNIAETYNNGTAAYYAAESGLEEGLLRNKYNKDVEIPEVIDTNHIYTPDPAKLLSRPAYAYRDYMSEPTIMKKPSTDKTGVPLGDTATDREQVYDLQTYYKQSFVGDDIANPKGIIDGADLAATTNNAYQIIKDNSKAFTINSGQTNDVNLFWKWISPACGALEVKIKDSTGNEHTSLFQDQSSGCTKITNAQSAANFTAPGGFVGAYNIAAIKTNMNISALTAVTMTLKPVGGSNNGIYFGFTEGPVGHRNSSGLATTIQSIGYFAGNSRQITAKIDRQTGTILDIFNYVIYKGQ